MSMLRSITCAVRQAQPQRWSSTSMRQTINTSPSTSSSTAVAVALPMAMRCLGSHTRTVPAAKSPIDALFGDDSIAAARLTPAQLAARDAARTRVAALMGNVEVKSSERLELVAEVKRDQARLLAQRKRENKEIMDNLGPDDDDVVPDRDIEAETFNPPPKIPEELKPLQHTYRPIHKPNLFRAYFDPDGNPLPLVGPNEPRPRWPRIDQWGRSMGTGRRKTSTARVWIKQGTGSVWVNKRLATEYFIRASERANYIRPFQVTNTLGQFDVWASVSGGGKSGQAGAIRHGIARALQNFDPGYRHVLKEHTFLERDARAVQSKHFGRKKARKRFQWHKR